jgi:hypothetical protein
MPTFVQPLERNREVVSMNFCPLDISRRASSAARAHLLIDRFPVEALARSKR